MKRPATPHPVKIEGNIKQNALVSLMETGRVRKKIVFELEELAAGSNGGTNALAGEVKVSSPTGDRKGGWWIRKARPGPFEANNGASEMVPGALPLLARELRFSMGRKEGSAWSQPEVAAGTGQTSTAGARPEDDRPEENSAVALDMYRSAQEEVAASLATMDEAKIQIGDGANICFSSQPILLHHIRKCLVVH